MTDGWNRHLIDNSTRMARPAVAVRHAGRKIGLYRVQNISCSTMLLGHGGISFPVGTELLIDDFQRLLPCATHSALSAKVVRNDVRGIALAWAG